MPRGKKNTPTVSIPDDWSAKFKGATMRTSFILSLSRGMLEYLCAVADDVWWDRDHFGGSCQPDCSIGTERCLEKRGLIVRKSDAELAKSHDLLRVPLRESPAFCRLTPAGELVVQIIKLTGIFVEADAAIVKKMKA